MTGVAWELGLLKGLRDQGVDVTRADTVLGTSAGSVVGAQITSGVDLDVWYAAQKRPPTGEIAADLGTGVMLRLAAMMLAPGNRRDKRRRIARAAVAAHPEPATERLRVIAERLRSPQGDRPDWPVDRDLRITAVDAASGELTVFTRASGVRLLDAVTASCAVPLVWPPVPVEGRLYVDGGVRSPANADLVNDHEVVLVLAPTSRAALPHHSLKRQLARSGARRTAVVSPDAAARSAIGPNVLDPARRAAAAVAGHAQASALAEELAAGWPG